jgi:L-fuconolactonase
MSALDYFRTTWAALTTEPPVDPDRKIVDPHHHLWERGDWEYRIGDYLSDAGTGHNITNTVFIECLGSYRQSGPEDLRPVGETEFVAAECRRSPDGPPQVAGIVSFADLTRGDAVEAVLEAHEAAGNGLFRGIRHVTAWDRDHNLRFGTPTDPELMGDSAFRRGLARLGAMGYAFDAWLYHPQLPQLADLARAAESATIVVDHLGGPLGIAGYSDRGEARAQWRTGMRALVACPNVVVKLGGLGMDVVFGTGWSRRERPPGSDEVADWWGDEIRFCIDTFGPDRCMFESNYPVDRESLGYGIIWNAFQKIARIYSDREQDELFAGTATRVYRLA